MTTLILKINRVDDVRLFPPRFLVDVSTYFDVITRHRHRIALFSMPIAWCPSAYDEDDLAGKVDTHDFGAHNAILCRY